MWNTLSSLKFARSATRYRNTTGEMFCLIGKNLRSRSGTILSSGDTGSTIPYAPNADSERRNNVNG